MLYNSMYGTLQDARITEMGRPVSGRQDSGMANRVGGGYDHERQLDGQPGGVGQRVC